MKEFKQLKVWQKGFEIAVDTYGFCSTLPKYEQFGLISQMTRSAVSIPSNVAESSSRSSDKGKARLIEISLGSSFELETQMLIAKAVSMGNESLCIELLKKLDEEQKMLNGYLKSLKG